MSEFDSWYGPGGTGSGDGSGVEYTAGWRAFLERFMDRHRVRSVLDIGCGDWQHSRLVRWGARRYVGTEVVAPLVERLRREHGGPSREFVLLDPALELIQEDFDLVICKDVFIHLPDADVLAILGNASRCRHLLLAYDEGPANHDIPRGGYREMVMTAPPFSLAGTVAYRFPKIHRAHKVALHVEQR